MRFKNIEGHTVFLPPLMDRCATVLDLGANQGAFSRWAATTLQATVYAVEALPELASALQAQAGLNVLHAAVGDTTGTTTIFRSPDRCASTSLNAKSPSNAVAVPALTLTDVFKRWSLTDIDLMKVDIEGSELGLLESSPLELLQRIGQITCEFHDFIERSHRPQIRRIYRRLQDAGFIGIAIPIRSYGDTLFLNRNRTSSPTKTRLEFFARKYTVATRRILHKSFRR